MVVYSWCGYGGIFLVWLWWCIPGVVMVVYSWCYRCLQLKQENFYNFNGRQKELSSEIPTGWGSIPSVSKEKKVGGS